MKLFHLSDLHIGKRVNEYSMLEDQRHILKEILRFAEAEQPDAVLLSGDLYDKPVPSAEAVRCMDWFLSELQALGGTVLAISGNHDSAERIAFGARLMAESRVFVSPVYSGRLRRVTLTDAFGEVDFYLLPFLKPAAVRPFFPEEKIESYTEALRLVVERALREESSGQQRRRVLLAHQFVTGAARSESEEISVGGMDNVDAAVFSAFDYVALGHIHSPQNIGSPRIRYCGTPLKYSFSEAGQEKSITVVELGALPGEETVVRSAAGKTAGVVGPGEASDPRGNRRAELKIRTLPLGPLHDMRELRGSYMELTARDYYSGINREDYIHVTLTDEEDIPNAVDKLRTIYHNLMKLDYDNCRTRSNQEISADAEAERKSPLTLFAEFYEKQNNAKLDAEERKLMESLIASVWEEEAEL